MKESCHQQEKLKEKEMKSNIYFFNPKSLWARLFGKMAKKTFDSGTTRLPATDLGIMLTYRGIWILCF